MNNNTDLINSKKKPKNDEKFRMAKSAEHASLFMQYIVLLDRNFKASSRNAVSLKAIFNYL